MTERPCIRCHQPVVLEDGHLTYCSHCGAPQIFLSDELQTELAQGVDAYRDREAANAEANAPSAEPALPSASTGRQARLARFGNDLMGSSTHPWPLGVRSALLSAAVALALGLLSLLLPPIGALMVVWVVAAPALTVALFHSRFRSTSSLGTGFAARLGLLTGLLVVYCCILVFALSLALTRFVFHEAGPLDAQLSASFAQQRSVVLARLGSDVKPTLDMFAVPEFRVGLLLSVVATSAAGYVLLSTIVASIAYAILQRRRSLPG